MWSAFRPALRLLATFTTALLCLARARGDQNLPSCPPDWKLELVAAAPKIRHPSVVCCAPDGRLFVAEDPMDISAASANLALGRVLCFDPDGRTTVFAEKLYAVFGMQYLEGKLYVLHNPKFSVFTDENGVGQSRIDLIESTNPNPWALDWNDHVPANFRLAMDGFFYVAVGDKGIYGAVGRDGKRIDLHGGGILRLRPDGTELEVFSTGVRNILDVAINAEDEIFTYDNTDEQQWMSRLTHMVEGGFYGYPYDFIPRQPYTLWMMADYGGGAATGAFAYNEDALPAEYHGNLFLADFGKRQILRVRTARDGGSYRTVSRDDFFSNVPEDFRPVGIALGPDGLSIYICDWNYRDTKAKVEVGRLFKLSFAGKNHAAPKPDWHLPAAMGRECTVALQELVQALSHPSQSVRLTAQRQIAKKAGRASSLPQRNDATLLLSSLIADTNAPSHARWHAVWALDAIDGGIIGRKSIVDAMNDADPSIRRQAIRQLGTRRVREAASLLRQQLESVDASIRFQAATALGRIADPAAVPDLVNALLEEDLFVRFALFTALRRIGRADASNWPAICRGLESEHPRVREATSFACREIYDVPLIAVLAGLARDRSKSVPTREAALKTLAGLHRQRPAWRGEWWAYHPVNAPPPQKTAEWLGTESVLAALRGGLDDPHPRIRAASLEGLVGAKDVVALPKLRELYRTESEIEFQQQLLNAFGTLKDQQAEGLVARVLETAGTDQRLAASAIGAAERIGGNTLESALAEFLQTRPVEIGLTAAAIEVLGNLKSTRAKSQFAAFAAGSNAELSQKAFAALVKLGADRVLEDIRSLLDHPSAKVRRGAATSLGLLKTKVAVPDLLKAWGRDETRTEAISALASMPDLRALDVYLEGLLARDAMLRQKCRRALETLREEALPAIESRLGKLPPEAVAELQAIFRENAAARKSPLFAATGKKLEPSDYLAFALEHNGDPVRGKRVFSDAAGAACLKCHTVGRQGGSVGPDLTTIGSQFARRALAESILYPSRAVREGYQQLLIETKEDELVSGLLSAETAEALTLRDSEGNLRRIPKADLKTRRTSALSLMPEGLHEVLSPQEFADLVAFLESLKSTEP